MDREQIDRALGDDVQLACAIMEYIRVVKVHQGRLPSGFELSATLEIPLHEIDRVMKRMVEFGLVNRHTPK